MDSAEISDKELFESALSDAPSPEPVAEPVVETSATPAPIPDAELSAAPIPAPAAIPEPEPQDRRVPLRELLDERDKRNELKRERDELQRQLAELQRQAQPPQPLPDPYADPQGYVDQALQRTQQQLEQQFQKRFIAASFAEVGEQHGERFRSALEYADAQINNGDLRLKEQIINAPNPGRALMNWYAQQEVIREVGTDPNAYRQKILDEALSDAAFRQKAMEAWRAQAQAPAAGRPATVTSLPPSLNRMTAAAPNGVADDQPLSDRELFKFATAAKR
jgi:hypothetical protein